MTIENDIETAKSNLRTISTLLGEALSQFTKLFQNEVDLAKAELGQKVQKIGAGVALMGAGAVLVIPGLVMVLFALSAALIAYGLSEALSYLLAAILAFVVGAILLAIGIGRLKARDLAPRETIQQLEKDKKTVEGMVR